MAIPFSKEKTTGTLRIFTARVFERVGQPLFETFVWDAVVYLMGMAENRKRVFPLFDLAKSVVFCRFFFACTLTDGEILFVPWHKRRPQSATCKNDQVLSGAGNGAQNNLAGWGGKRWLQ